MAKPKLERIVSFHAGYDCIRFECKHGSERCYPGGGGSHGKRGLEITFTLKGKHGAVYFSISTFWLPEPERFSAIDKIFQPMASGLGYHSKEPMYEDHTISHKDCEYTGGVCYSDIYGLRADDPFKVLCNGGGEALWTYLETFYYETFEDGVSAKVPPYSIKERK